MSTAAYDTASHRAASRRAVPPQVASRQAAASDDSWLDSWEAARDLGDLDPRGSVPGYFAPRIYRGRSVDELIPTIVAELGEDAVVIRHHRGLAGGFAGFFQKAFVEIEARRGDPGGSLLDRYDEDDAAPALPGDDPPSQVGDMAPAPLRHTTPAPTGDTAPVLPRQATPAPAVDTAPLLPRQTASAPTGDTAPALSQQTAPAPAGEFEETLAPVAPPKPPNWDGPTEVWATNPFAAALAEAEAAVRAAEPAVPPDLDVALAEALADVEDAEAPEEILVAPLPDLDAEPPVPATPDVAAEVALAAEPVGAPDHDVAVRAPEPSAHAAPEPPASPASEPSARGEIERTLRSVGIGEELVRELIEAATAHVLPLTPPSTSLSEAVHTVLTQMIPAATALPVEGAAIAVVGAGGSGKSTCCAALAEAYREHSTLSATCVTVSLDTPLEDQALRQARAGGLLLLDTPTVSGADPASIEALAALLAQVRPDRVVLALPATLGATPAAQLLEALRPLGADALAITHADETDQLGVAVQTACEFGLAPVHMLSRAEHAPAAARTRGDARLGVDAPQAPRLGVDAPPTPGFGADAPRATRAWALTWIDPFLLADRLLPSR